MSETTKIDNNPDNEPTSVVDSNLAVPSDVSSIAGSVRTNKTTSERQIKFERAQKCLENAALVSKRIKEHRKATAELLGRPFEDDNADTEMASTMSEKTNYSITTDTSTTLSVQDALNIPGISESLANTLKQKEILMERIKQYKEISKRPIKRNTPVTKRESSESMEIKKNLDNTDVTKLTNTIKEKENALSIMQVKLRAMETTILDLQEKINEKDQIIASKNKATTIITDSLSKKEKDTLDLLDDTKQHMTKMQNNFVAMEMEWKEEKQKLLTEIQEKDNKIKNLEEANTILENSRFELSIENSKLTEELNLKLKEISELQDKLREISDKKPTKEANVEQEKGSLEISNMEELSKKIELLEQINCQIRQTNKELENQLSSVSTRAKSPGVKSSPVPTRKGGRNTASKMKSPWSQLSSESLPQDAEKKGKGDKSKSDMILQSLNKDILDKEIIISQKDETISELESKIKEKDEVIDNLQSQVPLQDKEYADVCMMTEIKEQSQSIDPSTFDVNELNEKLKAAEDQIAALNNEIDIANKNMIKVKSNSKLKIKQMQKSIDNFSKISDANAEIVKLNEELHQLSQKVAELEEEKGNLQLHLVDYDGGRLTESEVYKKLVEVENLAEARLKSITLLETQKFDLVQELHNLQQKASEMEDKLADMSILQNEQVCSEMKLVQLEEQIDNFSSSKKEMEIIIENLKLDKEQLNGTIKILESDKDEISRKLESYIQENIELTDKLEKLSAEKVSSAESIEIVESLTTQEKMELEEYNRGLDSGKDAVDASSKAKLSKEELINEADELRKKIELFTAERQEVMEKMNKISMENESLLNNINEIQDEHSKLSRNIAFLTEEKQKLVAINEDLNHQIDELKRERIEVLKETAEVTKRASIDDAIEGPSVDLPPEDKSSSDKSNNRSKSVKQLTKEILKLKNIVKEREDEIADCQMKILSLEEQQEKQKELLQSNSSYEATVRRLNDENNQLRNEISNLQKDSELIEITKKDNEILQSEMQKVHQEYSSAINMRDTRIYELEKALVEYEKQAISYVNSLQQKDKEISEYINQITKLNDITQKLKSTLDLLEEEKAKNQNAESVKSLNKQISMNQKTLADYEERLRRLEEDKHQLSTLKAVLESKNNNIEAEITTLQDKLKEKEKLINEIQTLKQSQSQELSEVLLQAKERDEEIHEIKLQLRKESIENEKLHTSLEQKEQELKDVVQKYEALTEKLNSITSDQTSHSEQYVAIENKNKELLEKLKKYAVSIKKKSSIIAELESQLNETRKELDTQKKQAEEFSLKVNTLNDINEKLNNSNTEIIRLQTEINSLQEQNKKLLGVQEEFENLRESSVNNSETILLLNKDLTVIQQENSELKRHIELLNKKVVEYEIEQKNNINLLTKISCLENDLVEKEKQINDLTYNLQNKEEKIPQIRNSYEAKIQERDLYIESLQTDMEKYKERIYRLEQSISVMENSRQSLERKADQLDFQLQDKQKAYNEYMCQEDELVARLAVLIDHDRVVEKRLQEIEEENRNLKTRVVNLDEELQKSLKLCQELQNKNKSLIEKARLVEDAETKLSDYQNKICEMESTIKQLTNENQTLDMKRKTELDDLESEFNNQMEEISRDKKNLIEKYERLLEQNNILNSEVQQNKITIENFKDNLHELSYRNQMLEQEASKSVKLQTQSPDYTDQYISEINNLNSQINQRNDTISDLNTKLQLLQTDHLSNVSQLSTKIQILEEKIETLKQNNENLQTQILQKEEQIKQLKDNKKLVFEMNIPKTEGMTISSTIEPLNEDQREPNLSAIESQIMDDMQINTSNLDFATKKNIESSQNANLQDASGEGGIESLIVAKKAFVCYNDNEETEKIGKESDPFNSEEGWGLETNEEMQDITPGLSHLQKEINLLNETNSSLKKELETSNTKLSKAIKKLKELKSKNEMLSNELKLSKQLSDNSLLDFAIEKELASNVETLEKKVEELNVSLNKEKKENEALKKQNEVLKNANDRLIEIKEKADSEIQLCKYNLKQANDKLSSMQWGGESKEHGSHDTAQSAFKSKNKASDELIKLEKENDELQSLVENLNIQNKELLEKQKQLDIQICNLNQQSRQQITVKCDICQKQLEVVQKLTADLEEKNKSFNKDMQIMEEKIEKLKNESDMQQRSFEEKLQLSNENLQKVRIENDKLVEQLNLLKSAEEEANAKILNLSSDLELIKSSNIASDSYKLEIHTLMERCAMMEETCSKLNININDANNECHELQITNNELTKQCAEYEAKISQLNTDIKNLNAENDQLLSTVTELRSSISSAMDQRGFEIAELWKQHLAQRESEFQTIEHDLRSQLTAFQEKYEQLLVNVQSSSQEETNKLVIMEKMASLQNKIKEKEDHLNSLQEKYSEAVNQLDILRSEIEDEKMIYENKILVCQDEHEKQIIEIRNSYETRIEDLRSGYEGQINELKRTYEKKITQLISDHEENIKSYNVKIEEIQAQLIAANMVKNNSYGQDEHEKLISENEKLKAGFEEQLKPLIEKIEQLQAELIAVNTVNSNLNLELEDLRHRLEGQIKELTRQLQIKDSEIFQKTHDFTISLTQRNEEFETVRKQLIDYEKKIEDLTFEKESELAVLRLKMHEISENSSKVKKEIEEEKNRLYEELNEKIIECTNLNKTITDLNRSLEEYVNKATETQMVLESQEIEIVTLKDEVASLNEMLRSASNKIEKHVTFASNTKPEDGSDSQLDKELLNAVPKAELDLALYLLHQRDVRCEELTMELTQLLEERDTLQLRLSDSLRSYEELRSQMHASNIDVAGNISTESVSELPGPSSSEKYGASGQFVETHRHASRSSSISDPDGGKPNLQAKLSELRGVRHSRDVRFRNESEQRQLDMRLMHRDVANLPPEALDQLAQAQHTLSRDTQSTPTVLLNWLRGKSTPKVVHM
ncbi:golgin subfamily A member 4-like isoform X2 [Aricia agestis]|uniref:golgin subfamily A member 4-like isoform X2 n=1 Tax=Aricia agestis TaxID=91739 RepID=UPI001C205785|nr:golgin subfamily A member 4-like isoform X2 [Aricia agestis]